MQMRVKMSKFAQIGKVRGLRMRSIAKLFQSLRKGFKWSSRENNNWKIFSILMSSSRKFLRKSLQFIIYCSTKSKILKHASLDRKLFRSRHDYRHLRLALMSLIYWAFSIVSHLECKNWKITKDDCHACEHESNLWDGRQNKNYASSVTFLVWRILITKDEVRLQSTSRYVMLVIRFSLWGWARTNCTNKCSRKVIKITSIHH